MTAEELRIGNYVSTGNGVAHSEDKVTSIETFVSEQFKIGFNNRIDVKYYCDDIQPIPLTEQWLLDFGFEKDEDFKENHRFHHINKIVDVMYLGGEVYWIDNYTTIFHQKIIYVHQLQNLYFALTGEELTIKEKV